MIITAFQRFYKEKPLKKEKKEKGKPTSFEKKPHKIGQIQVNLLKNQHLIHQLINIGLFYGRKSIQNYLRTITTRKKNTNFGYIKEDFEN